VRFGAIKVTGNISDHVEKERAWCTGGARQVAVIISTVHYIVKWFFRGRVEGELAGGVWVHRRFLAVAQITRTVLRRHLNTEFRITFSSIEVSRRVGAIATYEGVGPKPAREGVVAVAAVEHVVAEAAIENIVAEAAI
jgi:hypothetical protein